MLVDRRTGYSLYATGIGWTAGSLWYIVAAWLDWEAISGLASLIASTVPFVILGWLILFLPAVNLINERNWIFRPPIFTFAGGVVGLVTFLLLPGFWVELRPENIVHLSHPVIVGTVACALYAVWLQGIHNHLAYRKMGT